MIKKFSKVDAFKYSEELYSDFCNNAVGSIVNITSYSTFFVVSLHLEGRENLRTLIKETKSRYSGVDVTSSYLRPFKTYAVNFHFYYDKN